METLETISGILGIVMLVFGILQIILFFKVWGMTNDVHAIKQQITPSQNLLKEIQKKNPNIESILFDAVYSDMQKSFSGEYIFTPKSVREKYKLFYQKAGVGFPDVFEKINDWQDWCEQFEIQ